VAAAFHIYIGYRSVSSFSLRGWMALKKSGAEFAETFIRYRIPEGKARLRALSPSAKVPLLVHRRNGEEVKVWDSLAIGEYLADFFPEKRLWPADPVARAYARSISAEMHSGFPALRRDLSMQLFDRTPKTVTDDAARADIARVQEIWTEARERWGAQEGGPFLFGRYTVADAMYCPVVTRFRTYATPLNPVSETYSHAVLDDPDFRAWEDAALREPPVDPEVP
jgi:glutathione S-transferase